MQPDIVTSNQTTEPVNNIPTQPTPYPRQPKSRGLGIAHYTIFGVIGLAILILLVGGVYEWQHKRVDNLNQQVATTDSQLQFTKDEVNSLQAEIIKDKTSSSSSTTTLSQSLTLCTTSDLKLTADQSSGAAGNDGTAIIFTNISKQSCTLYGYPTVQYYDASGTVVSNVVEELEGGMIFANPSPSTVTLTPNHTASVGLSYTEGGANSSNATKIAIFLPGQSTAMPLDEAYGPSTANTGDPFYISVTSFQSGSVPAKN